MTQSSPELLKTLPSLWKLSPAATAAKLSNGLWRPAPHLRLLSACLQNAAMGRAPRTIVTMPPRHGKSEMISHWGPVWFLDNFPDRRVILSSYEGDFAMSWGRKAKGEIIRCSRDLTVRLSGESRSNQRWETAEGGGMVTAGVGGPITGRGANLFIIDDPVKNRADADSFTVREATWNWWTSTARTRLEPAGAVILTMTRWHEDDLAGRLIQKSRTGEGEAWDVINLPAVATVDGDLIGRRVGEALWPWRYDLTALMAIKKAVSTRDWSALFQQDPSDDEDRGDVYYTFTLENVAPCSHDPRLPLVWSLDFNVDPMCSVIGQQIPGPGGVPEEFRVLDEIILQNSNTYEMCEEFVRRVLRMVGSGRFVEVVIHGDASGSNRTANSTKTDWQIVGDSLARYPWIRHRFHRRTKNPPVKDRVNAVIVALSSADGTRSLFIDPRCAALKRDFQKVRYEVDSDGLKRGNIDKSNKSLTHISDALGYWIEMASGLSGHAAWGRGVAR